MEIVYFHVNNSTELPASHFVNGGWCVEFFFILSGFLMAYTWKEVTYNKIIQNAADKTWKKLKAFAPIVWFCFSLVFLYRLYLYQNNLGYTQEQIKEYIRDVVWEIFFLNGIHWTDYNANGPSWYLSTLLICVFFIYMILGILSRTHNYFNLLVYSAIAFWGYYNYFEYRRPAVALIHRGFGGLCLGLIVYEIYRCINKHRRSTYRKIIISLLEIVSLVVTGLLLSFDYHGRYIKVVCISFSIIILCSFLNETRLSHFLDHEISALLGKLSMGIYLGHILIVVHFEYDAKFRILVSPIFSFCLFTGCVLVYTVILTLLFDKSFRKIVFMKAGRCWYLILRRKHEKAG